jgi:hypothetical protein
MDLSDGLILMFTFLWLEATPNPTKPAGIKKAI